MLHFQALQDQLWRKLRKKMEHDNVPGEKIQAAKLAAKKNRARSRPSEKTGASNWPRKEVEQKILAFPSIKYQMFSQQLMYI